MTFQRQLPKQEPFLKFPRQIMQTLPQWLHHISQPSEQWLELLPRDLIKRDQLHSGMLPLQGHLLTSLDVLKAYAVVVFYSKGCRERQHQG